MSKLSISNINLHDLDPALPNEMITIDAVVYSLGTQAKSCLQLGPAIGTIIAADLLTLRAIVMAMVGDRLGAIDQLKRAKKLREHVMLLAEKPDTPKPTLN